MMHTDEYVVLRSLGDVHETMSGTRSIDPGSPDGELNAERAVLSSDQVADVRREQGVLGVAPVMPVLLVAPTEAQPSASVSAGNEPPWGLAAIGALDKTFIGRGVVVAVLDTGINAAHDAFRHIRERIAEQDFTGEGNGDNHGHGTHCAGTVFGGEVGGMPIGVAPGVERALIGKVLDRNGQGSTAQILDGVLWAARQGANVMSVSLGLDFPGMVRRLMERQGLEVEPATSQALSAYRDNVRLFDKLSELLRAHGAMFSRTLLFAAAGNESRRPKYTIATAPPAAADGFISVGAIGRAGADLKRFSVAPFSNTGPELAAPGVDIVSAHYKGGLRIMSGTSMATPHVAGVAARWLEKLGGPDRLYSIDELRGRLIGSATRESMEPDVTSLDCGAGLVQAPRG